MRFLHKVQAALEWKKRLTFGELVDFMDQWFGSLDEDGNPIELDPEQVEGTLGRCSATLKEVPIDSLTPGFADGNLPDAKKEKAYAKMPMQSMPPIIVQDGVIIDGNHRWRVAKKKKQKTILIYDCQ